MMPTAQTAKPKKKSVVFISGGVSAENEIALLSAQHVYPYLEKLENIQVLPIYIAPNGQWLALSAEQAQNWPLLSEPQQRQNLAQSQSAEAVLLPSAQGLELLARDQRYRVDLIFPMMHGPQGEDGSIQGLAQFFGVPVLGSDMSGSLLNMDKVLMKAIVEQKGLPTARYFSFSRSDFAQEGLHCRNGAGLASRNYAELASELFQRWSCAALYVKPARMGSSVGMSQVKSAEDLHAAIDLALRYDEKLLIEEGFSALELEFAALELDSRKCGKILLSDAATIDSAGEFYSFEQKYFPEKMAHSLVVKAYNDLPKAVLERAKDLAHQAFFALGACHYARVDLFYLRDQDRLLFNEINTIPGFTAHSMFPKLMAQEGWPMERLLPHLLDLALAN